MYTCEQWSERERERHINLKELVAMVASTEAFLRRRSDVTHVREFTDNTCAEWAAHGMAPRGAAMQEVMTHRAAALLERRREVAQVDCRPGKRIPASTQVVDAG